MNKVNINDHGSAKDKKTEKLIQNLVLKIKLECLHLPMENKKPHCFPEPMKTLCSGGRMLPLRSVCCRVGEDCHSCIASHTLLPQSLSSQPGRGSKTGNQTLLWFTNVNHWSDLITLH